MPFDQVSVELEHLNSLLYDSELKVYYYRIYYILIFVACNSFGVILDVWEVIIGNDLICKKKKKKKKIKR